MPPSQNTPAITRIVNAILFDLDWEICVIIDKITEKAGLIQLNILGYKSWKKADWDAAKYSSGVYFYKLTAGDPSLRSGQVFVETKKMMLIK